MEMRVKFEELNQNLDAHLDEDDQQFDTRMRDGVVVVEGDIVRVTSEPIEGGNRITFETMSGYSDETYTGSMYYSYAFNIYSAQNLTADLPIYLVCVPQADGQVKLHSSPIAQAIPASKDNLVYIYLGRAVDGTHGTIDYLHPCYYHNGVSVVPWHDEVIA